MAATTALAVAAHCLLAAFAFGSLVAGLLYGTVGWGTPAARTVPGRARRFTVGVVPVCSPPTSP